MKKRNRILKTAVFALLLFAMLLAAACGPTEQTPQPGPGPDDDPEEEVEPMTNLTIGGKSIANFKILNESGDGTLGMRLRTAIANFSGISPIITQKDPGNGKIFWIKVDPQQSPASCRVYVDGERTLVIAVHHVSFISNAVDLFIEQLNVESSELDFPAGFSVSRAYEPISYQSVATKKMLVGDSDKSPISYQVGETAVFTIAAITDGSGGNKGSLLSVPYFRVSTWNEDTGKESAVEYVDGSKGYFEFTIPAFSKAGYFHFKVNACDEDKKKIGGFVSTAEEDFHFVGGVGFGISEIEPAAETPANFDSYWQTVANEVKAQSSEGRTLEKVSGKAGYTTYYWTTPIGGEIKIGRETEPKIASGYLTVPNSASATNQVGLRLVFKGYSTDNLLIDPAYKEQTITLSVCSHSINMERAKSSESYYGKYKQVIGSFLSEDYMCEMVKRDLFGAKFLVEYFGESGNGYWDGENFEVTGGSMGAMQSTAVAALTKLVTGKDVSLLNISIPWMCDVTSAAIGRRPRTWPSNVAEMDLVDEVNFAHLITCRTVIYAALGDHTCPVSGITVLYNQLRCEKEITFEQNTSHSGGVGGGKYTFSETN